MTRAQIITKLKDYSDAPDDWFEQWTKEDLAQMLINIINHFNSD
jgi:hypothetical protein